MTAPMETAAGAGATTTSTPAASPPPSSSPPPLPLPLPPTSCQILWSTQSGRAKACARRTARILQEQTTLPVKDIGAPFDEVAGSGDDNFIDWVIKYHHHQHHNAASNDNNNKNKNNCLLLLFVSTTGDGEHCDSILQTWKLL
jgi:hypothetical protein